MSAALNMFATTMKARLITITSICFVDGIHNMYFFAVDVRKVQRDGYGSDAAKDDLAGGERRPKTPTPLQLLFWRSKRTAVKFVAMSILGAIGASIGTLVKPGVGTTIGVMLADTLVPPVLQIVVPSA